MAKALGPLCNKAFPSHWAPEPGLISLQQMWDAKRNYVIVVDNDEGLYDKLVNRGFHQCIYRSSKISGGYAGEQNSVDIGNGKSSSTNLWQGLFDQVQCERCDDYVPGRGGLESADTVRSATEKILLEKFRGPRESLHETSYIWVYGTFAGFGDIQSALFRKALNDSSLIGATDKKRLLVDDGLFYDTYVDAGLKPYAEDFINDLRDETNLRQTGHGVGIVNMDAIGRDDTFEEFIRPLLRANRAILDE